MTTSDWITLGAAILVGGGTLFLGIMAWRTIRQTRSIQKAERRERLLNEILNWILDIAECGFILVDKDWVAFKEATKTVFDMKNTQSIQIGNLEIGFLKAWYRGTYIKEISSSLGKHLQDAINKMMEQLSLEIDICDEYRLKFTDITDDLDAFNALLKDWVAVSEKRMPIFKESVYSIIHEIGRVVRGKA